MRTLCFASTIRQFAVVLASALLCGGCYFGGQDSDRNKPKSDKGYLEDALAVYHPPRAVYWLGQIRDGHALLATTPADEGDTGVLMIYRAGRNVPGGELRVITYPTAHQPHGHEPNQLGLPKDLRIVVNRVMPTGQRVLIALSPRTIQISHDGAARLGAALRPVTRADLAKLPETWSTIG